MAAETASGREWVWVAACMAVGAAAAALVFSGLHPHPLVTAAVLAIGIVGGAFLLSWAAEAAQIDVSASLAIAVLALVAILPEYSIEAVLAWKAGASFDPENGSSLLALRYSGAVTDEMSRVAANVTGANRLLIGIGWSLVVLIYYLRRRRPLDMRGGTGMSLEIRTLTVATLLSFLVFAMSQVHVALAAVMIAVYLFYLWVSSAQESGEPHLVGVSLLIGSLPDKKRRTVLAALFVYAVAVILVVAEPFVESLVETGREMGIDEFILIQWVAPLASEAPEIVLAILFSLRANPLAGMTTLISAEVNQLTLLIGSMVVVFSLSSGEPLNFGLESRQAAEFLLTSAMSLFAVLLIASRVIDWKGGAVLLGLFVAHLFFTSESERMLFAYIFLALSVVLVVMDRKRLRGLVAAPSTPA